MIKILLLQLLTISNSYAQKEYNDDMRCHESSGIHYFLYLTSNQHTMGKR